MAFTGNQATISFGSSGWTACFKMIGGNEETILVIDTDCLSDTVYKSKIIGDLADAGEMEIEFYSNPNNPPPYPGQYASETIVVTFPTPAGLAGGATATFPGAITKRRVFDKLSNNEVAMGSLTVTLLDGPTYSDAPVGTYA